MKMIIGVLFLGLVAFAFGAANVPRMPDGCDDVHSKAIIDTQFRDKDFFKGQWHLTHAKRVSNPNACETFTVGNGNQVTFSLGGVSVSCTSEYVANATFTKFTCQMGGKSFTSYLSVLATDYDNYALVYRCGSHEGPTKANYQVGQRTKSTTFPAGLRGSLSSKGMQESEFSSYRCS